MKIKRIFGLLLVVAMLLALVPQTAPSANAATAYFGIDVSENNSYINWYTAANNIDFAIIRCGYGMNQTDQDDGDWYTNANACTQLGIPFGTYLYSYATTTARARSEAEHVLRLVEGYDMSLPIFYDLEDSTISSSCSAYEIYQIAKTFCDIITDAGYTVGIYANLNWWENYLYYDAYDQWYKWVAQYSSYCSYSGDYAIWQYGDTGSVGGVSGSVDVNYWYGSFPGNAPTEHTCNHSQYAFFEAAHPHYSCYTCPVCGDVIRVESETNSYDQCFLCQTPETPALLNMSTAYPTDSEICFRWEDTSHTTHYNLWLEKQNENGEYVTYEQNSYAESGLSRTLPAGNYRVQLQSYNFNFWENDDCPKAFSGWYSFTVSDNYECCLYGHQCVTTRVEPTCTADGSQVTVCSRCGDTISTEILPATGHSYAAVTVAPTCTQPGSVTSTCIHCGESHTEATAATGHDYHLGICGHCGEADPDFVQATFEDVAEDSWYAEPIAYMVGKGLMTGVSESCFAPEATMTRGMLVDMLWRYAGCPESGSHNFVDVSADHPYSQAIAWASSCGIVNGMGGGCFAPDGSVTREQLAVILYRYAGFCGFDISARSDLSVFADAGSFSDYATDAISWAVAQEVLTGDLIDGSLWLCGQTCATRGQVAAMFMRFIETVGNH